jgi:hypothetical protein
LLKAAQEWLLRCIEAGDGGVVRTVETATEARLQIPVSRRDLVFIGEVNQHGHQPTIEEDEHAVFIVDRSDLCRLRRKGHAAYCTEPSCR